MKDLLTKFLRMNEEQSLCTWGVRRLRHDQEEREQSKAGKQVEKWQRESRDPGSEFRSRLRVPRSRDKQERDRSRNQVQTGHSIQILAKLQKHTKQNKQGCRKTNYEVQYIKQSRLEMISS